MKAIKEEILFSNTLDNTETLRTLTKFNVNKINYRIYNINELLEYIFTRCGDFNIYNVISQEEEIVIFSKIIKDIDYFKNTKFDDAVIICRTFYETRLLITSDNELEYLTNKLKDSHFTYKNESLIETYKKYQEYLDNHNLIDRIGYIRLAIKKAIKSDLDIYYLKEEHNYPLILKLINSFGNSKEITFLDLYNTIDKGYNINKFISSYGEINECLYVIDYIYKNNLHFDECVVASTNPNKYYKIFNNMHREYGFDFTNGFGFNIIESSPGELLKLINDWDTINYHNIDGFRNIIYSKSFDLEKFKEEIKTNNIDVVIENVGNLKLSFDIEENNKKIDDLKYLVSKGYYYKELDATINVKTILNNGLLYLINNFYKDSNNKETDLKTINTINNLIDIYSKYNDDFSINEIVDYILNKNVNRERSEVHKLNFVSIDNLVGVVRKNVFILGMGLGFYLSKPKENYLFLDEDLIKICDDNFIAPTSDNLVLNEKEYFFKLINLLSSIRCNIILSYSNFDLSELKDINPESLLFDVYSMMNNNNSIKDFNDNIENVSFFQNNLSKYNNLLRTYLYDSNIDEVKVNSESSKWEIKSFTFSPTQIEKYIKCEKQFFLSSIIKLTDEQEDDPAEIIKATMLGNIVHEMFELYAKLKNNNQNVNEWYDYFIEKADEKFDDYIITRTNDNKEKIAKEKYRYLEMIKNGFELNKDFNYVFTEKSVECQYSDTLKLGGKLDALVSDKNNNYIILDYKTKKNIEHEDNNYETCIQALLYAYILEHQENPIIVKKCYFEYLRFPNKIVSCDYDDEAKIYINNLLSRIDESINNCKFEINKDKDSNYCNYCKFGHFCGKKNKEEDE